MYIEQISSAQVIKQFCILQSSKTLAGYFILQSMLVGRVLLYDSNFFRQYKGLSGQSYKQFKIVIYDSKVAPTRKLITLRLYSSKLRSQIVNTLGHFSFYLLVKKTYFFRILSSFLPSFGSAALTESLYKYDWYQLRAIQTLLSTYDQCGQMARLFVQHLAIYLQQWKFAQR